MRGLRVDPAQFVAASRLVIAIAQVDTTVGDVSGNADKVRRARVAAKEQGADLVCFSELFLAGYPPEDLVLKPAFQEACRTACEALARETSDGGPAVLVGLPWVETSKLYNAYALLANGRIEALGSATLAELVQSMRSRLYIWQNTQFDFTFNDRFRAIWDPQRQELNVFWDGRSSLFRGAVLGSMRKG